MRLRLNFKSMGICMYIMVREYVPVGRVCPRSGACLLRVCPRWGSMSRFPGEYAPPGGVCPDFQGSMPPPGGVCPDFQGSMPPLGEYVPISRGVCPSPREYVRFFKRVCPSHGHTNGVCPPYVSPNGSANGIGRMLGNSMSPRKEYVPQSERVCPAIQ